MNRADCITGLTETLLDLSDKQMEYLYHLVKALFGNQKEDNKND